MARSDDVVVIRDGEQRAAAEALAAGHADYPAFRHVFPDPARRARSLPPFFEATVRDAIPFGAVVGVPAGTGFAAVAVWLPPGAFPWTARRKLHAVPAFTRVLRAYPRAFRTFARYGANAERHHPREPHWYLVVLSIRPAFQRRGLGTSLVECGLERADASSMPCYLETSDRANVAFYQRFGFEVVDSALPLVPGGPTHVAMWRSVPSRSEAVGH